MTTRVAGYMRVSTGDQTVRLQRDELTRYAKRRGFTLVRLYEDVGISGLRPRRPGLDELLAAARRHRFEAVIVWKFDRFSRSVEDLLASLRIFQSLGIDFISVTEGVDTSTPLGEMLLTFLGALARFEAAVNRERVIAGVQAKRARQGGRWGRRPVLGAAIVDRARHLLLTKRQSLAAIARSLDVPRTTLRRALQRTGRAG